MTGVLQATPWVAVVHEGLSLRAEAETGGGPSLARLGERVAVLDGGLDDRLQLARSLRGVPADAGDAELVLAAYADRGSGSFARLRGRFSLVLWDGSSGTVIALRDPMGAHPLFWARGAQGLAFSPYVAELLRLPGVDRAVSPVVAVAHVLDVPAAADETFFPAIKRVPAGRLLRARGGGAMLETYWDPPIGEGRTPDGGEVQGQFEELLDGAVERCVPAGPVGVFLSGGLDSATVATAALATSKKRGLPLPVAVSVFNPSPDADERSTQQWAAAHLGLGHHTTTVEEAFPDGGALRASLALAGAAGAPPGLLASVFDSVAGRAVRDGCGSLLTGDGGDEWLMPAPEWAADRLLHLDLRALHQLWRAACGYYPHDGEGAVARELLWRWAARPLLAAVAGHGLARRAPDRLRRERRRRALAGLPSWLAPAPELRRDFADWMIDGRPLERPWSMHSDAKRAWLSQPGLSLLMEDMFMTGLRLGAEVRMPLHDPDLVAFLLGLPPETLLEGGRAKAPSRRYLARSFGVGEWPPIVYADSVWEVMMERERMDALRAIGKIDVLAELGVVDPGTFVPLFERGSEASGYRATRMWEVLSLESWLIARTMG